MVGGASWRGENARVSGSVRFGALAGTEPSSGSIRPTLISMLRTLRREYIIVSSAKFSKYVEQGAVSFPIP